MFIFKQVDLIQPDPHTILSRHLRTSLQRKKEENLREVPGVCLEKEKHTY